MTRVVHIASAVPWPDGGAFGTDAAAAARPAQYELGVLAEPDGLFLVVVGLAVGPEVTDRELGRLHCEMQRLVPLQSERRAGRLYCWLLCTAPSAAAAAWKTVEAVRAIDGAMLDCVEAGLAGDRSPQVVLTREIAVSAAVGPDAR